MSNRNPHDAYIVTPALIPKSISAVKLFNYGDALVKEAAIKYLFNSRLRGRELSYWDSSSCLEISKDVYGDKTPILALGTNCISANFSLFKNADNDLQLSLVKDRFCALLFVGLFGIEPLVGGAQPPLEYPSKIILESILDNGLISTRCSSTYAYLCSEFPDKTHKILASGCISAAPIINFSRRDLPTSDVPKVLFSLTCRNGSDEAEAQDLRCIIRYFQPEQISLIVTQNRISEEIARLAELFSINVIDARPLSVEQYYTLIGQYDIHVGSRAHVHIPALSLGLKSILTGFESRHRYFQKHYCQPVLKVGTLSSSIPQVLLDSQELAAQQLINDSRQRVNLRNTLLSNIQLNPTTYNITSYNQWPVRSTMCINELSKSDSINNITEIGAGSGFIASQVGSLGLTYRGFDIQPMSPDIKRLNANSESVEPTSPGDCLVCLGLLEYISEIPCFLQRTVSKFNHSLITYNVVTALSRSTELCQSLSAEMRMRNEWSDSGYTLKEFIDLLKEAGMSVLNYKLTKYDEKGRYYSEYMFKLAKSS